MYKIPEVKKIFQAWNEKMGGLNYHKIPTGPDSKLPLQDQLIIKKIIDYWYPPSGWDRHVLPSMEANKRYTANDQDEIIKNDYTEWL